MTNTENEDIDEFKNAIISNISHELRTPLVAIRGYAEIMSNGGLGELNDKQQNSLKIIVRNVDKLVSLITDFLDFSKIVSKKNVLLKKEIFLLSEVVETVIEKLEIMASEKKIKIELKYDKSILVEADKHKIGRILFNLIQNSIKFNKEEGYIKICFDVNNNNLIIEISDSGIGIPQEKIDKVFESFYKVDYSDKKKYDGVGIGLSVVKEYVYLHKGNFKIEKSSPSGTVFKIKIPIVLTGDIVSSEIIAVLKKKVFFLFCNNNLLLLNIKRMFLNLGFNIIDSSDAFESDFFINKYNPDMIFNFITEKNDVVFFNNFNQADNIDIPLYNFIVKTEDSVIKSISLINMIRQSYILSKSFKNSFIALLKALNKDNNVQLALCSKNEAHRSLFMLENGDSIKIFSSPAEAAEDEFDNILIDLNSVNFELSELNSDIFENKKFFFAIQEINSDIINRFFEYDQLNYNFSIDELFNVIGKMYLNT
ncbi:HAMP domain-containing histidine kinase, partial [Candidatus Dependentiae bacterium]|nr:HAMP domain-containing histidine kinase [Candidatus Dependentiae bacterium]